MKANDIIITVKITDESKRMRELWGLYNGLWMVTAMDFRKETVEISNGRVSLFKRFDEVELIEAKVPKV